MTDAPARKVGLKEVFEFFKDEDFKLAQFRVQWGLLSDNDKTQIIDGIGNGTLTY